MHRVLVIGKDSCKPQVQTISTSDSLLVTTTSSQQPPTKDTDNRDKGQLQLTYALRNTPSTTSETLPYKKNTVCSCKHGSMTNRQTSSEKAQDTFSLALGLPMLDISFLADPSKRTVIFLLTSLLVSIECSGAKRYPRYFAQSISGSTSATKHSRHHPSKNPSSVSRFVGTCPIALKYPISAFRVLASSSTGIDAEE